MKLFIIFIILNAINVILQTVKSILTIRGNKIVAALANGIAYGLYTVVIVYTVCDLSLMSKVLVVGGCNFIGVYIVKLIEEKARKDKMWKIETAVPNDLAENFLKEAKETNISFNTIAVDNYTIFNFFCATQNDSLAAKAIITKYNTKCFVSESKTL